MALIQSAASLHDEQEYFLDALSDSDRAPLSAGHVAVVIAHPDDETIGCGAQLPRFRGASIIVVTNGAPRKVADARAHGCWSPQDYAALRAEELCQAMSLARMPQQNIVNLGIFDQAAARQLGYLTRSLYCLLSAQRTRIVLTHAYEGGHPDHDATAFAVHAAAALRRRRGQPLWVIEMPFYRAEGSGWAVQRFPPPGAAPVTTIRLNQRERRLKRAMVAAHHSQRQTLAWFTLDAEYFRPALKIDFLSLPNNGSLLYERYDWGMTGEQWLALTKAAQCELGLGESLWA